MNPNDPFQNGHNMQPEFAQPLGQQEQYAPQAQQQYVPQPQHQYQQQPYQQQYIPPQIPSQQYQQPMGMVPHQHSFPPQHQHNFQQQGMGAILGNIPPWAAVVIGAVGWAVFGDTIKSLAGLGKRATSIGVSKAHKKLKKHEDVHTGDE